MRYKEIEGNLFDVSDEYYLAHCISSDCGMGAGIAVEFNKNFDMRNKMLRRNEIERIHPTCILEGKIFNLITKEKYWKKPTYSTLTRSLEKMKEICVERKIDKIAMPMIGCGIDKLEWTKVREIIHQIFKDEDIEILVCILGPKKKGRGW